MFKDTKAFSGFSVKDLEATREFYGQTLGLEVEEQGPGLRLKIASGNAIVIYPKEDHVPATSTILNFPVDDIDHAVRELGERGVKFEQSYGSHGPAVCATASLPKAYGSVDPPSPSTYGGRRSAAWRATMITMAPCCSWRRRARRGT